MKRKALICLILGIAMVITCACGNLKDEGKDTTSTTTEIVEDDYNNSKPLNYDEQTVEDTSDNIVEDTTDLVDEIQDNSSEIFENKVLNHEMVQEVKDYILYGQDPYTAESMKAKWDPVFLEKVNIESLYEQFVAEGGEVDDIVGLTWYITKNAPIADDWEETFRQRYEEQCKATVTRLEYMESGIYQVYELRDGKEQATVGVNPRTGYWHN